MKINQEKIIPPHYIIDREKSVEWNQEKTAELNEKLRDERAKDFAAFFLMKG